MIKLLNDNPHDVISTNKQTNKQKKTKILTLNLEVNNSRFSA